MRLRPAPRALLVLPVLLGLAALAITGAWHAVVLFAWQHPLLSWLAVAGGIALGAVAGTAARALGLSAVPREAAAPAQAAPEEAPGLLGAIDLPRIHVHRGVAVLGTLAIALYGGVATLFFPSNGILDDVSYDTLAELPRSTQPRLLPRTAVRDDPLFFDAKEIHLVRDPARGGLVWTGEWQARALTGGSRGVVVKPVEEIAEAATVVRAPFDRSVSGFGPTGVKWKAKLRHPFSRSQYPVLVPAGEREAFAILPYVGYRGFPFRHQYLKGVLVYHQDGRIEDLEPEEAAHRPELRATGRLFPESLARRLAEALARTDELEGEIADGDDNRQPYLVSLDAERAAWVTVIDEKGRDRGVKALVFTDSTSGATSVWKAPAGFRMVSTQEVVDTARSLPLRWKETRCCDSDGHAYTVTLREVAEPRLAFKDGEPYYLVSVVPTDELAISREIEHTLIVDGRTGETIRRFDHVANGALADEQLQRFFE